MMTANTAKTGTTAPEAKLVKRSLWKRLLIRFVMLLLVIAVGGTGYLYYRSNRLIKSEPYQAALKYVTESKIVKAKVGEPLIAPTFLQNLNNGSSLTEEGEGGEARLQFTMMSPKGPLDVSGRGHKFNGIWSIAELSVLLPGETERVSLRDEVQVETAKETPKFDPTKPPEKIDINVKLPDPHELKFDELPVPPK